MRDKILPFIIMLPLILVALTMVIVATTCVFSKKMCNEMIEELRR